MRKHAVYLIVVVCFISIIFGCAGAKVERGVQDNVFYSSSNPNIEIKISPDIRYREKKNNSWYQDLEQTLSKSRVEEEAYIFSGGDKHIKISFVTIFDGYWRPLRLDKTENKVEVEKVDINGNQYDSCIYLHKGIQDSCYMMKRIAGLMGRNTIFNIYYSEKIDKSTLDACEIGNSLSSDQIKKFEEFKIRSNRNIQISGYDDSTS